MVESVSRQAKERALCPGASEAEGSSIISRARAIAVADTGRRAPDALVKPLTPHLGADCGTGAPALDTLEKADAAVTGALVVVDELLDSDFLGRGRGSGSGSGRGRGRGWSWAPVFF